MVQVNSVNLWTALVTPFHQDESLDIESFQKLIKYQVDGGVKGLLLYGSTGEAATLTEDEKARLAQETHQFKSDALVMMGITHNNTSQLLKNADLVTSWGADVILVAPPYYNKPTHSGLIKHFTALHEHTDLPIVLYNIPGRVSVSIDYEVLQELAQLPRVIGLKEANQDLLLCAQAVKLGLTVWSGDDPLTLPYMSLGALGSISVCSNLFPGEFQQIVDLAGDGNFTVARERVNHFVDIYPKIFSESNPLGIKCAMAYRGLVENAFRLPMTPMSKQNTTQLQQALKAFEPTLI